MPRSRKRRQGKVQPASGRAKSFEADAAAPRRYPTASLLAVDERLRRGFRRVDGTCI
jgi:hypothetical protein